ncbi:MAG TPA: low affinity iron permease family protein [Candidatus Binatia bacterium]
MNEIFHKFAYKTADAIGAPISFVVALLLVIGWGAVGPLYNYSDTWQLVINTGTTIVTFLIVFLIQNTQNRDTKMVQIKIDELIRAVASARNKLLNLEDLSDDELISLQKEFEGLGKRAKGVGEKTRKSR